LNGLVPVLAARRSLKDTMRMDVTQLQGQDNNPLKFLPSGDAVLQALAAGKLGGFLSLSDAVERGFSDIKAHEVAAMVALQGVVKAMLVKFDPAAIETRDGAGKLFGRGADKAKSWDLFVALHGSLAGRSDETTRRIVNEEFSRAYAEQVRASAGGEP
jgi:type VI secretion system FHA domain protein